MRFLGPLVFILLLTGLAWTLVGVHVVGDVPGGWSTIAGAWAIAALPVFVLARNFTTGRYPSAATRLFLFRPFWYAQLLMLALALASSAAFLLGLPFGAGSAAGRCAVLIGAVALISIGLWGYVGSRRLVVRHITLSPPRMPRALDGLRIVQLTDLHVGPQTSRRHLARIADAARVAAGDIIAYTGDQVDDHPADIEVFASAFGTLQAPLGVYAIPGNHDVYAGWDEVRRRTETMGVRVLVNDAIGLEYKGTRFCLAGTGDPAGRQMGAAGKSAAPDVDAMFTKVPHGAFCVTLAHNPALFPALAPRADVVLSGHTHHGQFSIPSRNWSLASVFLEYAMGTYERSGSLLYVSPGTNYWGIPFRIGALPEVTVVTFRAVSQG
ncbi:MAG TPA: metallophosphoesterase [Gemmatimonadaceae bacterium]|nr:metallophosphoesterase [Gemmatimonadaceae bacterium]